MQIVSIILLVGFVILSIGLFFIILAGDSMLHPESIKIYDQEKMCTYDDVLCIPYFLEDHPFSFTNGLSGTMDIDIQFKTFDTWAVKNIINYTFIIEANQPNAFDEVYYLILQPNENTTRFNGQNIRTIIDQYDDNNSLITLKQKTKFQYVAQGIFFTPVEGEVKFYGILIKEKYGTYIPEYQPLLRVGSHLQKLQADTNKELLKQIQETRITNDRILGLTIVLVALVPIGLILESLINEKSLSVRIWRKGKHKILK